mmetsp:Transcript_11521/g.15557  ORF Transcript_11521/g.15557 Transcript_11521/m.15557 type:complete len:236 (-) Transcript_11521:590-1297(-)
MHLLGVLLHKLQRLIGRDLQIEHVLAFDFFLAELLEHNVGLVALVLQLVVQLHLHLSLGLEILSLLISFSNTTALNLKLNFEVLFVDSALLSQNLFDLRLRHLLLVLKVFNARHGNRNVNLNQIGLLASLVGLSLRLLGKVAIVEFPGLHVLGPAEFEVFVVEDVDVVMEHIALLLHLLGLLVLLRLGELALLDRTVGDRVVAFQTSQRLIEGLQLRLQDLARVVLCVHRALQVE